VLRYAPKVVPITPIVVIYQSSEIAVTRVPFIRDPSYCEDRLECPPRVQYYPEITAFKFTLHCFTDSPGVFKRLKYIVLIEIIKVSRSNFEHDGAAVFNWTEESPVPPARSAKDVPEG
jgi:hypothetical protein